MHFCWIIDRYGIICRAILTLLANPTLAQDVLWQRTMGGAAEEHAQAYEIAQDGSYLITGSFHSGNIPGLEKSHHDNDIFIAKVNSKGRFLWKKSFGGRGSDVPYAIKTFEKAIVCVGSTDSPELSKGKKDAYIAFIDAVGNMRWSKAVGGPNNDEARCVISKKDGIFVVGGECGGGRGNQGHRGNADGWVIAFDRTGNVKWETYLGGTLNDHILCGIAAPDGGYVFAGYSNSSDGDVPSNKGGTDVWVVKLDHTGKTVWKQSFGGNLNDEARSIAACPDAGYVIAGVTQSTTGEITAEHGAKDVFVMKISADGRPVWKKSFGGSADDEAHAISMAFDGNYLVSAQSKSKDKNLIENRGMEDGWIFKVSGQDGKMLWQKVVGGEKHDVIYDTKEIPGGDYVAVGGASSKGGNLAGLPHAGGSDVWILGIQDPDNKDNRVISLTPTTIIGYVRDAETQKYIEVEVKLVENYKNRKVSADKSDTTYGIYNVFLPDTNLASIGFSAQGYMFYSQDVRITDEQRYSEIRLDVELRPIKIGEIVQSFSIHFDIGKSTLRPESKPELDRVVEFLKQNPTVRMRISGHTDGTGEPDTKKLLSQNRATAVKSYIINAGINAARLESVGYGMERRIAPDDTEENRQKNRRVEFEILAY
jgi:outer membrane protein OmpA-like peptidoglycan-associated protein